MTHPPAVLSFAAADPTGGAGSQADLLTLAALGCVPLSVLTAYTVQDTFGVHGVQAIDPDWVEDQARTLLEDISVAAFKIGLLGSVENIAVIAEILADYPDVPVVLDPVLASGRGDELADEDMLAAMRELLLPQITLLTPNSLEARRLAEHDEAHELEAHELDPDDATFTDDLPAELNVAALAQALNLPATTDTAPAPGDEAAPATALADCAAQLIGLGCGHVLITGTHESSPRVENCLYGSEGLIRRDVWERLPGSYHGSGCTLASAIAAHLAHGHDLPAAVHAAQAYTWQALRQGFRIGMGQFLPHRYYAPITQARRPSR